MLKRKITYKDFNGTERSENFYFNLTETELMEMEMSAAGGFKERVQSVIDAQDTATIIEVFKDFILKSYGEKSPDGKYFDKSPEISRRFANTNAYSVLFMELAMDANKAAEFIKGIVPEAVAEKMDTTEVESK